MSFNALISLHQMFIVNECHRRFYILFVSTGKWPIVHVQYAIYLLWLYYNLAFIVLSFAFEYDMYDSKFGGGKNRI